MRLALGFNPVLSVRNAVGTTKRAESLGYESLWFHESLYQRDAVSYLAAILLSTSRLRVGSGVINTFTRHPISAAATFASLSEMSDGRAILGLGLGSFPTIPKIGYKIFPVGETRPLHRIREYVEILRSFWKGETVNFKGEYFTAQDLQTDIKLTHEVPLYIASLSARTLSFAGSDADGAILSPALSTAQTTGRMLASVQRGEKASGRTVDKASYILTSVDPDRAKARDAVRSFYFFLYQLAEVLQQSDLDEYGLTSEVLSSFRAAWRKDGAPEARKLVPDGAIDALTACGTTDEVRTRIQDYPSSRCRAADTHADWKY